MTSGTKRLYKPQKVPLSVFLPNIGSYPTPVEEAKSSNDLREILISFQRTHVTAKRQIQCFVMVEPNTCVEGRLDKILKYTVRKFFVWIPLGSHYLENKRTRLFTVRRTVLSKKISVFLK